MPRSIFQNLAHLAAMVCQSPEAYIVFSDVEGPNVISSEDEPDGLPEQLISALVQPVLAMVDESEPTMAFTAMASTGTSPKPLFVAARTFYCAQGTSLGAIVIVHEQQETLTDEQHQALVVIAGQLTGHYETNRELIAKRRIDAEFHQLLDNVDDAIFELDERGHFTLANAKTCELLQVAHSELPAYHVYDFVHPSDLPEVKSFHNSLVRDRKRRGYFEMRVVPRQGGEPVWLGQQVTIEYSNRKMRKIRAIARDLSIVRHLRQALDERESQYKVLSENSRDIIGVLAQNGTYKYISHSVKEIIGYDPGEILGKVPFQFLHREDIPIIRASLNSMVMGGHTTTNFECRVKKRTGEYIWVETYAKVIRGPNGQIAGFHTSARDITDRKRDANNLSLLIENTTDAVWAIDRDYRFMYFNSVFGTFYKKQTNQYPQIGQKLDWAKLMPNINDQGKTPLLKNGLAGKKNTEELQFSTSEGLLVYENSASPILNEEQKVLGVCVFSRDITDSFIEKERVLRYQAGLRLLNDFASKSEPLRTLFPKALKAICEHLGMPTGMISEIRGMEYRIPYFASSHDPEFDPGDTFSLESSYCQLVKYNHSVVLIDEASGWEYGGHPCYDPWTVQSYLGAPIKLGEEVIGTVNFISKETREEGFTEYDGEFMQLFANWISTELTKEQTFNSLQLEKDRAEAASVAKANFLSMMSHEVRTPLNGIIGTTHLLLDNCTDTRDARHLEILKKSGDHLQAIVTDILDFAKIEEGKVLLDHSEFNLRELLENVLANYEIHAEEKNIELELDYDPKASFFYFGDQVRLNQIFHNLTNNAVKFTEEGKVTIRCRLLKSLAHHDHLQVEVEDTGIGIGEQHQSEIFQVFCQADDSITRKFGGSGLGLSITKKLLELMDSKIKLESEEGKGTIFRFELALKQAEGSNDPVERLEAFDGKLSGKVLIVEDNLFNRVIAKDFLQSWGLQTVEASNGQDAIGILQEKSIDLVLLDIQMPVMDGNATAQWIRSQDDVYYQLLPIIALTASALMEVQTSVYESGMNDFLTKPFVPEDFFRKVEYHLKRARSARSLYGKSYSPEPPVDITGSHISLDLLIEAVLESIQQHEAVIHEGNMTGLLKQVRHNRVNLQAIGLQDLVDQSEQIEQMIKHQNPATMIIFHVQCHLTALKKLIDQLFAIKTKSIETTTQ